MNPQQRHDLANVAQAVFWAVDQGKPNDALAELELHFEKILKESNDAMDLVAKAHRDLDDIRNALGLEMGALILPAIATLKGKLCDANNRRVGAEAEVARLFKAHQDAARQASMHDFSPTLVNEVIPPNIVTLERYAAECFPEVVNGQKHFVRILMESVAEELRRLIPIERQPDKKGVVV